jgi:hypothetical protein
MLSNFRKKEKGYEITLLCVCVFPFHFLKKKRAHEITLVSMYVYGPQIFRFLCGPRRISGKLAISSSQNFLLILFNLTLPSVLHNFIYILRMLRTFVSLQGE